MWQSFGHHSPSPSRKCLVHVPNFGGVAGSEDFGCATLPTTPLDFQGKIWNFFHPTLQKIRSKITVTPPPQEKGQSQNYGASINSKFTFQKHFEEILGRCYTRCHRIRLLVNKKWGSRTSTKLQIYKQCVWPIFEYGSLSTITTSDTIISKIQRLQNKFIRLALHSPKYISAELATTWLVWPSIRER